MKRRSWMLISALLPTTTGQHTKKNEVTIFKAEYEACTRRAVVRNRQTRCRSQNRVGQCKVCAIGHRATRLTGRTKNHTTDSTHNKGNVAFCKVEYFTTFVLHDKRRRLRWVNILRQSKFPLQGMRIWGFCNHANMSVR